jgi:1-phosphofructokinase family hexose kinase
MITTVTLNPMLDKTVSVGKIRSGGIARADAVHVIVGGKGVNVARQIHRLGGEALAVTFAGGETGSMMERLLSGEGLPHRLVRVNGMTREGVTYREADGTVTSVFEPQHHVTPEECRALVDACAASLQGSSWVACSGSSPCRETDGAFAEIIGLCQARAIPVALDSYGEAMTLGAAARPGLLKLNRDEFQLTFGRRIDSAREASEAAREVVRRGITWCVISDGPRALVAATSAGAWIVDPPAVTAVNPTGSGDALLAGIIHGLARGGDFPEALAFGVAAGAANAAVWDVCGAGPDQITELLDRVHITRG